MKSTTHEGEFFFRGSAKIFVSTMLGLFGDEEGFSANPQENGLFIRPRVGGTYYEFIRFSPFELPDRTLVRWYSPEKANLGALAVKMIERLGELGYIQEVPDRAPQAGTEAAPAGMVGADEKTAERLEAVRGWPEAKRQGARRRDYCAQYSIDESTLTKWRAALKKQGYDVPDFA